MEWVPAIAFSLIALALLANLVRLIREDRRKTAAWLDHMREMGRECPACKPWGGWYLGAMKPGGGYETHICEVCDGTGKLPRQEAGDE